MDTIWIDDLDNVEDVINLLINKASDQIKDNASHDAILVLDFFPRLGPDFYTSPDFSEEQVKEFKEAFNYERYGLDKEVALKKIEKYRSVDRILDKLVEIMPVDVKNDLMRRYLLEVWYTQNSNSDLEHFKSSLKRDYWLT